MHRKSGYSFRSLLPSFQIQLMKYYTLFLLKIRENVAKFVVCCSCDWRFMGLIDTKKTCYSTYQFTHCFTLQTRDCDIYSDFRVDSTSVLEALPGKFDIKRRLKIKSRSQYPDQLSINHANLASICTFHEFKSIFYHQLD